MNNNASVTIRPPKPDEYEKIIACIKEARGSSYYSAAYYDAAYLRGDEHELFAAFDDNGEMAGFTGLSGSPFENDKSTLSVLNIRPAYTGRGIATELLSYSVELLKSREARLVKGYTVTRYPAIQHVLEDLGLKPAGVLRCVRDGKNADPLVHGKCTLAIYARNFAADVTEPLFVHTDAAGLAVKVYSDLGIELKVETVGQSSVSNDISHYYDSHDDVIFTNVNECESGLGKHLGESLQYPKSPNTTELVFLNLYSPSAICGYESLRDAGYRFCGFDPLGKLEYAVFYRGYMHCVKPETTGCLASLLSGINEVDYDYA